MLGIRSGDNPAADTPACGVEVERPNRDPARLDAAADHAALKKVACRCNELVKNHFARNAFSEPRDREFARKPAVLIEIIL